MGQITSGIGLMSGINTAEIIEQLMALESRPKMRLQSRVETINQQRLAFVDLSTRLSTMRLSASALRRPSTFMASSVTSSNEQVMTATAADGSATGTYQFQVARLVTTQQSVSRGFADRDSTPVGAGTITIEQGGGELRSTSPLERLNGGEGVARGHFRITDRAGNSTIIDTTSAVTLDDVVRRINTALEVNVTAEIACDGLVLNDASGGSGNFIVQDLGGGSAAAGLGLVANVESDTITGASINRLGRATSLDLVNDGRGVRTVSGGDLRITAGGESFDVDLNSARSLGDVLDAINAAANGQVEAAIASDGKGITLTNTGGGPLGVEALNGSNAAGDLGIEATAPGGVIEGTTILAGLNTVLISSLNGGSGLPLGEIEIIDAGGGSATVDLAGAVTVREILDRINSAAGVSVQASLNASGNGIRIVDESGGTGNLVIADVDSSSAEALGIAGSFSTVAEGANLQRQWVSENTLLSGTNGGRGVTPGSFRITDSTGASAVVDLTAGEATRLKDVIAKINQQSTGIVASINANGDGLLLTDTAGGGLQMSVENVQGTTASDLRINGVAEEQTIDGSFEVTIEIGETDTLEDVQRKINEKGFGVSASIINDGSGQSPYRLSLNARDSGVNGRVVFDAGSTSLGVRTLVEARDAAVFLGGIGAEEPLLITSGQNQLSNVIRGVTIDLHGLSDQPVNLTISRSVDKAVAEVDKFAEGFNEIVDRLNELTKFDAETSERGLLMGDSAIQRVQSQIYSVFTQVVEGAGRYRMLSEMGIRIGEGAKIEFDEDRFRAAYAEDSEAVKNVFAQAEGFGNRIYDQISRLIDPVDGVITRSNQTLDSRTEHFENRIRSMDRLLEGRRQRLERQFAQLESILAGLHSQQEAIGQIQTLKMPEPRRN